MKKIIIQRNLAFKTFCARDYMLNFFGCATKKFLQNLLKQKAYLSVFFLIIASIPALCPAQTTLPFNDKVTVEDKKALDEGTVLIRSIDKYKNVALKSSLPAAVKMLEAIKELSPNYLAESIQIRKVSENEDLLQKIAAVLTDIPHYAGIPYWSVQHERYWDLYESAKVKSVSEEGGGVTIYEADLYMEPFGNIESHISFELGADYLLYINENTNNLKFNGKIQCIGKHKMKSAILIFKQEDNWVLYALGGCKTFKILGFEKRVERSLINRIKTFCNYVFTKVDEEKAKTE